MCRPTRGRAAAEHDPGGAQAEDGGGGEASGNEGIDANLDQTTRAELSDERTGKRIAAIGAQVAQQRTDDDRADNAEEAETGAVGKATERQKKPEDGSHERDGFKAAKVPEGRSGEQGHCDSRKSAQGHRGGGDGGEQSDGPFDGQLAHVGGSRRRRVEAEGKRAKLSVIAEIGIAWGC